eukprot:GHRR01005372.1.p1 GENE.GHRR01005372.1~~GHRR01005372.1.p1  ORF type:complete len:506 (+),score=128.62 GHRR01005372.1:75-1592(+)
MSLGGALCRVLWFSSLAYQTLNSVTIELATPRSALDGLAFCFVDQGFALAPDTVAITSIGEGGDIWNPSAQQSLSVTDCFGSCLLNGNGNQPLSVTNVTDILGSDPYYASSYYLTRYDDLVADRAGKPLPVQLLQQLAAASRQEAADTASNNTAPGSCVILSGRWQGNTRYTLTLAFQNPAEQPSSTIVKPPDLYMLPLTVRVASNGAGAKFGTLYSVRGAKQGHLCQLRPRAAVALPRMFSACAEAVSRGLAAVGTTNTTVCLEMLQDALASNPSFGNIFPFSAPPVSLRNTDSAPDGACSAGSVRVRTLGAECIDCSNAAVRGDTCKCYPGYMTNLIGPAACGPPINPAGNASDAAELAAQLCTVYNNHHNKMIQGELSDKLVHSMYLDAFARQAAYLLDWSSIAEGNATFWQQFVTDERVPSSPSRRTGIGPNCTACNGGVFRDIYTQQQVPVRDDRFLALQTFRLLGYLLSIAGYPCSALWNSVDPMKQAYGSYDKRMCVA